MVISATEILRPRIRPKKVESSHVNPNLLIFGEGISSPNRPKTEIRNRQAGYIQNRDRLREVRLALSRMRDVAGTVAETLTSPLRTTETATPCPTNVEGKPIEKRRWKLARKPREHFYSKGADAQKVLERQLQDLSAQVTVKPSRTQKLREKLENSAFKKVVHTVDAVKEVISGGIKWMQESSAGFVYGNLHKRIDRIAQNPQKNAKLVERSVYQQLKGELKSHKVKEFLSGLGIVLAFGDAVVPFFGTAVNAVSNSINTGATLGSLGETRNFRKLAVYSLYTTVNFVSGTLAASANLINQAAAFSAVVHAVTGVSLPLVGLIESAPIVGAIVPAVIGGPAGLIAFGGLVLGLATNTLITEVLTRNRRQTELNNIVDLIDSKIDDPNGNGRRKALLEAVVEGMKRYNYDKYGAVRGDALVEAKAKLATYQAQFDVIRAKAQEGPISSKDFKKLKELTEQMMPLPKLIEIMQVAQAEVGQKSEAAVSSISTLSQPALQPQLYAAAPETPALAA